MIRSGRGDDYVQAVRTTLLRSISGVTDDVSVAVV